MQLAFDTSGSLGSVAVGRPDGTVAARRLLRHRAAHAAGLVPAVGAVLDEAGIGRGDVEGVVVGAGPGSFTGVRVGAATAKGLVRALGVPLRAISSLAAGAVTAGIAVPGLGGPAVSDAGRTRPRRVLVDARADRLYAATYRVAEGRLEVLEAPRATRLSEVLDELGEESAGSLVCGSGARRHCQRLEAAGARVLSEPAGTPTADALLRILALDPPVAPVENPRRWEPEYVRPWAGEVRRGET